MVDEIGSDGELADGKRLPGIEVVEVERISVSAEEYLRGIDQAAGQLADVDRSAGRQRSHEAEVVLVRMADKHGINSQARDVNGLAVSAKRKTYIDKNRCLSR
jgi:hypothetical protein